MAPDRRLDRPRARIWSPFDERQVLALQPAGRQQRLQSAVYLLGFGNHEQTGGVAVEPVDDARPPRLIAAGRNARESLGQRAAAVAAPGMYDHARRFIDDQ